MGLPSRSRKRYLPERRVVHVLWSIGVMAGAWALAEGVRLSETSSWGWPEPIWSPLFVGWRPEVLDLLFVVVAFAAVLVGSQLMLPREDPLMQAPDGQSSGGGDYLRRGENLRFTIMGASLLLLVPVLAGAAGVAGGTPAVVLLLMASGGLGLARRRLPVAGVLFGVAAVLWPVVALPIIGWLLIRREWVAVSVVAAVAATGLVALGAGVDELLPYEAEEGWLTPLVSLAIALSPIYLFGGSESGHGGGSGAVKTEPWDGYRPSAYPCRPLEQPSHGVARELCVVVLAGLAVAPTGLPGEVWLALGLSLPLLAREAAVSGGVTRLVAGVAVLVSLGWLGADWATLGGEDEWLRAEMLGITARFGLFVALLLAVWGARQAATARATAHQSTRPRDA